MSTTSLGIKILCRRRYHYSNHSMISKTKPNVSMHLNTCLFKISRHILCISVFEYPQYRNYEIVFDYCDLFGVVNWNSSLRHKMQFRKNEIGVISMYKMLFVFISVSLSLCIHNSLGQSWRKNDRIEAFRTKKIIGKQFVCPDKDVTFELVTGKLHS